MTLKLPCVLNEDQQEGGVGGKSESEELDA